MHMKTLNNPVRMINNMCWLFWHSPYIADEHLHSYNALHCQLMQSIAYFSAHLDSICCREANSSTLCTVNANAMFMQCQANLYISLNVKIAAPTTFIPMLLMSNASYMRATNAARYISCWHNQHVVDKANLFILEQYFNFGCNAVLYFNGIQTQFWLLAL